jgi:autotransporter-associated beta strand protein
LNGSRLVGSSGADADWRARISVWKRSWVCGLEKMSKKTVSDPKARLHGLLGSTALVGAIVSAALVLGFGPAFAAGGDGGGNAGSGGADSTTVAGGDGVPGAAAGQGGGGGGAGKGPGGDGLGTGGGAGGAGGNGAAGGTAGTNAVAGGNGAAGAATGDGGGGGGGGGVSLVISGVVNFGGFTASAGGAGGAGNGTGGGGGGGAGGVNVIGNGATTFVVNPVSQRFGGAGGAGGASAAGLGGSGGSGGAGFIFPSFGPANTLTLDTDSIIGGGSGGAGGIGGAGNGAGGAGGAGISAANTTINNNGGPIVGGNGGAGSTNGAGGAGIIGSDLTIHQAAGPIILGGLAGDGVTRADAITLTGGTNTISFAGATSGLTGNIGVTGSLNFNQATNVTVSNVITGSGSVTKSAAGTLTLSGGNTYSGGTNVAAGSISIGNIAALGTGTLTFTGNNTALTSTVMGSLANGITVNAGVSATIGASAGNTLTIGNSPTHLDGGAGTTLHFGSATNTGTVFLGAGAVGTINSGTAIAIDGGTVVVGNPLYISNAFGGLTVGSGVTAATLDLNGRSETVTNLTGTSTGTILSNTASAILNASNSGNSTFAGTVADGTGGLALQKTGTGILTLSGANTYSGGTSILAGTLAASNDQNLGNASGGLSFSGGTLQFVGPLPGTFGSSRAITLNSGGGTIEADRDGILSGNISGAGGLTKTGIHELGLGGNNTYLGATHVNDGVVTALSSGAFSSASRFNIASGASVNLNGFNQTIGSLAGAGTVANFAAAAATLTTGADNTPTTFSGAITDGGSALAVTKVGGGTLILSGTNTYTGATNVNNGVLAGGAANAFSAASATTISSGANVDLGGFAQTINSVTLAGGALNHGSLTGAVTSTGGAIGSLGGGMSLVANGSITAVFANNTYTGATTVNNGATLFSPGDNAFSATSAMTINSGGRVLLAGTQQTINAVALAGGALEQGVLTGAVTSTGGALNYMVGSMSLTANGGTTGITGTGYSGATTVNNGAMLLSGGANGFSAASATTINTGGMVDLGGFAQTINAVALAGGTLTNGGLTGAVTSTGGTLNSLGGAMSLVVNNGATNITGINTYAGATTVNGGLLSVNGSVVSAVTVNTGGTLGGNGAVGSTTVNGGVLSPGNSIGLLTVNGSLVFTSAASYLVEVSPVSTDRTNVTGAATLGGATVNASFAPGTYVAKQYTILNAGGGVHGRFSSLVNSNLPSGFHASLSYDTDDDVYLNLALNFVPPPGTGLNVNQQNVGNAIVNFFNSTGGIPIVFGALTPAGLTQLSGEVSTGSQQTTFDAMNQFLGVITDPFVAGRGDGVPTGGTAAGYADEEALAYAQRRQPSDALAAIYGKAPQRALTFEQRWSVWAAAFGGSQTTNGNVVVGSNDTRSSIYGTAVGAAYRFSPNTIAGFAIAGGGTNFSVANSLGGGRSDLFQAGAFIRHDVGPVYLTAALAYGWQDITTDRTVTVAGVDRLRAEFKANAWSGRLEGGYRFVAQGFGLTPYAAGQATTFDLPNYAETAIVGSNIFALAYNSKSVTDTRSELGLRSDKSFAVQDGVLTLRGRAAWAHDFNPDRSISATFQTLPGASFVANGAAQAHDSALVAGAAEMKWLNGWSTAATFEGELSNVTRSYAGKGVARYQW